MIKNVILTQVPKDEDAIKKALAAVKDHTWSDEAIKQWVSDPELKYIWYTEAYGSYVMSKELPKLDNMYIRPYHELKGV